MERNEAEVSFWSSGYHEKPHKLSWESLSPWPKYPFSPKLVIIRLGLFLSTVCSLDLSTMDRTCSAPVVASKLLSEGCGVVWKVTQLSFWKDLALLTLYSPS